MLAQILGLIAALAAPVTQNVEQLLPPKKGLSPEEQKAYNEQRAQAAVNLGMTAISITGALTGNPWIPAVMRAVNNLALAQQKAAAQNAPPTPPAPATS